MNIDGDKSVGSKLGGTCSLTIFIMIAVFTFGRVEKLTNRLEPSIYEVNQGIDMNDPDTPVYNLKENKLTFGIIGFVRNTEFDDNGSRFLNNKPFDLTDIFEVNSMQ